jgi:dimethylamine/trimethylamine dehydrogenase
VRAAEEGSQFNEVMDDLVDYWDINIGTLNWGEDAGSSRYFETNQQAEYTRRAKRVSKKPIINVGRFTDPDVMLKAINSGQCDIIGAARPSIADPFLPVKIEEGRYEDIRECIGCNACLSRWEKGGPPIWCTQNPTSGDEYRRGWHPEVYVPTTNSEPPIMVVGAGPAGLECAMTLGRRGYEIVHVVDAADEVGGHLKWVSGLPGFAAWKRVIDWRETQINMRTEVQIQLNSKMSYEDILECGAEHVIFATGSTWDGSGMSAPLHDYIAGFNANLPEVATPEQYMLEDKKMGDNVLVIDNDAYFMGSAMAQLLAQNKHKVTYVTYPETVGPYQRFTLEEQRTYEKLMELDRTMIAQNFVVAAENGEVVLAHMWSGQEQIVKYDSIMLVTHRISNCDIHDRLQDALDVMNVAGIRSIHLIGEAHTPGMIAQATFSGTRLAREIDSPNPGEHKPFICERRLLNATEADYQLDAVTLFRAMEN